MQRSFFFKDLLFFPTLANTVVKKRSCYFSPAIFFPNLPKNRFKKITMLFFFQRNYFVYTVSKSVEKKKNDVSNLFIWACPQSDLFISGLLTIKSVHMGMPTIRSVHIKPFTIKSVNMGMPTNRSVYVWPSQSNLLICACPQSDLYTSGLGTIKSVYMDMTTIRFVHIWLAHNQICLNRHGHNQICSYLPCSQSNLFI